MGASDLEQQLADRARPQRVEEPDEMAEGLRRKRG